MGTESILRMSNYNTIAAINEEHNIYVVQDHSDMHIYIKKILDIYNLDVYTFLADHPIPFIPHIYELYEDGSRLIVIEEYIAGNTLEELLSQGHPFTEEEIRSIALQLCDILKQLHDCSPSIIHRDIKPSNIILNPAGQVYLLDLNAAKYHSPEKNEDTKLLGTKGYAAPEQYGFGTSNPQTDIYALGMVMNTLLHCSFSTTPYETSKLSPIVKKCIQLDPKDRFKEVSHVKKALLLQTDSSFAVSDKTKYLPPGFRSLKPINMTVATLCYAFSAWISFGLELKDTPPVSLFIQRTFCFLIFIGTIFFTCDYLNIQSLFPFCRTQNIALKMVSIVLVDICYIFVMFILMVIIVSYII